ncbi:MAG: FHA domain-containing protein [Candidatus Eisenbacteria bacterium]|uniref:FHA domain-containing protein n=1 Tax=Eiseniibacteriota bacterium TaxID=2212470 RepID=A0A538TXG0_UNCEI|nr:MAG: FHA domain-containing protein [Candidatus Eisenbacteria bacterium]
MLVRWIGRASWAAAALASVAFVDSWAAAPIARPADPVRLSPAERDSLTRAIEKERAATEEWLREKPTSYLATVQRTDFGDRKTLTVGRAPRNDVRIADDTVEPHHLRITVVGDSFHVVAVDTSARFVVDGAARREATLAPGSVLVGRLCSIHAARASRSTEGSSTSRWISPTATFSGSRPIRSRTRW